MRGSQNKQKDERYLKLVDKLTPNSDLAKGLIRAFWVGGVICVIGQLVNDAAKVWLALSKDDAGMVTAVVMVFFGSLLTGIGVYDRIGKYAGAGSIVPITGFANSIVASAMEFRREGLVLGVGAKLFLIAGPVLVYGIGTSILVGIIAFFVGV
ncbi:MAG: stage V sporulation protein AC [Firmicutes bacterium]|nr:stage V sporulation protein AC [Bacillota bacterium]